MRLVAAAGWLAFAFVVLTPRPSQPPPLPVYQASSPGRPPPAPAPAAASLAAEGEIQEVPLGPTPKIKGASFLPPNANPSGGSFGAGFPKAWGVPSRLNSFSYVSVNTAMDWHFAMMNDVQRNAAYDIALRRACQGAGGKVVLDIGSGSGLLAMLAAQGGAAQVYTVEANPDYAKVAAEIVELNGLTTKITVLNTLSTKLAVQGSEQASKGERRTIPRKADVLVAEIIGTLLLSESQLDYIEEARNRLLAPGGTIIPASGRQYITLIEMPLLQRVTQVEEYNGLNLRPFNQLRDTASLSFSKVFGFHLRNAPYTELSPKISVQEVDFYTTTASSLPSKRTFRVRMRQAGVVHAALATWAISTTRGDPACATAPRPLADPALACPQTLRNRAPCADRRRQSPRTPGNIPILSATTRGGRRCSSSRVAMAQLSWCRPETGCRSRCSSPNSACMWRWNRRIPRWRQQGDGCSMDRAGCGAEATGPCRCFVQTIVLIMR